LPRPPIQKQWPLSQRVDIFPDAPPPTIYPPTKTASIPPVRPKLSIPPLPLSSLAALQQDRSQKKPEEVSFSRGLLILFAITICLITWTLCIAFSEFYLKNYFTVVEGGSWVAGAGPSARHFGRTGYCEDFEGPYRAQTVFDIVTPDKVCFSYALAMSLISSRMQDSSTTITALYGACVSFTAIALIVSLVTPFTSMAIFLLLSGLLLMVSSFFGIGVLVYTAQVARDAVDEEIAAALSAGVEQGDVHLQLALYPVNLLMVSATVSAGVASASLFALYIIMRVQQDTNKSKASASMGKQAPSSSSAYQLNPFVHRPRAISLSALSVLVLPGPASTKPKPPAPMPMPSPSTALDSSTKASETRRSQV